MKKIREFFWPLLEKTSITEKTNLTCDDININAENIEKGLELSFKIYESELSRSSSIETKSSIFIGTLAVITSILLSITTTLVNQNEFSMVLLLLVLTLFLLVIYVLRTVWFAIKVLERKGFHTFYHNDILREEKKENYYRVIIASLINKINKNSLLINEKVNWMVMSQEYFKRAIIILSIYSFLILTFFIEKSKLDIKKLVLEFIIILNAIHLSTGFIILLLMVAIISIIINFVLLKRK